MAPAAIRPSEPANEDVPAVGVADDSEFSIAPEQFFNMIIDKNKETLQAFGGVEGVAKRLKCDLKTGISTSSIQSRIAKYDVNYLPPEEEMTFCKYLLDALSDKMMILLLVLGTLALILGLTTPEQGKDDVNYSTGWIDGTFIIVAVTIVILVTCINDYLKGQKFAELNRLTSKVPFKCLRDGKEIEVDIADVIVGDLVKFGSGAFLPADGLYIAGQGVTIDESAATGENDDKRKDAVKDPFIMSGTNVLAAEDGLFLVIAVGRNSFSGRIEIEARDKGKKTATPLQEKLEVLADVVGWVGVVVAAVLFLTLATISIIRKHDDYDFKVLLDYAIIGVSIIVVAVPEGLPLSVVIALAYSMTSMMKDNNMVRSLAACETMGAATSICSDKTGTLTTNEMTQIIASIGGVKTKTYDHNGTEHLEHDAISDTLKPEVLSLWIEAVSFNSTASQIEAPEGSKAKVTDGKVWIGNKTEQGLLRWANRVDPRGVAGVRETVSKEERRVYPFQSSKKTMASLVRLRGKTYMFCKGAPEIVLEFATEIINGETGEVSKLTDAAKQGVKNDIEEFAKEGLRTLGVAYKEYGPESVEFPEQDPLEGGVTFLGVAGIEDPVRTEVPGAVKQCQNAGVTVRMCTGDNINTAKAISKKCDIFTEGGVAMEGPEFRKLFCDDEAKFMEMLPHLQVLARCSPLDKQLLVGNLMLLGEVVAVTGDGTNDAPALRLADVGFAMNDGTDVAKKASKIILLDNNFVSVVKACKWGRNVNDNIRKFLQFQFTVNCVLLIITFIGAVKDAVSSDGDGEPPLAPIHLLWANLIMDTMAALALSTENPNDELLTRPPTYRDAPLISRKMKRFVIGGSIFQLAVLLTLIFAGEQLFQTDSDYSYDSPNENPTPEDLDEHEEDNRTLLRTVIFNVFIYMQVFNWFHARKLYDQVNPFEGFSRSPFFLPICLFVSLFQAFMVEVAGEFMETRSIGGVRWGVCIALALVMFPVGSLLRLVPVEEKEHVMKRLDHMVKKKDDDNADGDEDDDSDDEYGPNTKLRMVEEVRQTQRQLIKGAKVPIISRTSSGLRQARVPPSFKEAVRGVQARLSVVRALRGIRGKSERSGSRSNISIPSFADHH
ncbi:Calcium-transporting ATPase PAT1 [Diplonema papillatum]|nr:Calcium-transporting ATPase PAT1 [Diplonema papillatum]